MSSDPRPVRSQTDRRVEATQTLTAARGGAADAGAAPYIRVNHL